MAFVAKTWLPSHAVCDMSQAMSVPKKNSFLLYISAWRGDGVVLAAVGLSKWSHFVV